MQRGFSSCLARLEELCSPLSAAVNGALGHVQPEVLEVWRAWGLCSSATSKTLQSEFKYWPVVLQSKKGSGCRVPVPERACWAVGLV